MPPGIIVGIIGVETRWGRVMGRTRIIDALATPAFDYPRRGDYFATELETFLLMVRDEGDDPLATLSAAGLSPLGPFGDEQQASLLRLDIGTRYQYWYWPPNFYVITRYNHNTQYAMAVWQLGNAVKQARPGG